MFDTSWVGSAVTVVLLVVGAVMFVSRQEAALREAIKAGDEKWAGIAAASLAAAGQARDMQHAAMSADLKAVQRDSASKGDLTALEGRLVKAIDRIGDKMDAMGQQLGATAHLADTVRGLSAKIDARQIA